MFGHAQTKAIIVAISINLYLLASSVVFNSFPVIRNLVVFYACKKHAIIFKLKKIKKMKNFVDQNDDEDFFDNINSTQAYHLDSVVCRLTR